MVEREDILVRLKTIIWNYEGTKGMNYKLYVDLCKLFDGIEDGSI
jgi:hypothetical protein